MRVFTGLSRGGLIAIVVACVIAAAGGLAAVTFIGGGGGSARMAVDVGASARAASGKRDAAAAGMPQVVAMPREAVMPKTATAARAGSTASGSRQRSAHPSSSSSTTEPPGSGGSTSCAHPAYVTSAQYGMWNQAPYFVYNDMWDISGYQVTQTLYACSYSNWYAVANMNNDNGDGHVKTYPNSHRDFDNHPEISSLHSVTSTFAESSPDFGIYEDAYDIDINVVSKDHPTELMIWTHNHGQSPGGSLQGTVTLDGRAWQVWKGVGSFTYVAIVAEQPFTSGTLDLLSVFNWLIGKGWIPANSTLDQVCFGAEIVSTNGAPATFSYSNFSVSTS